MEALNPYLAGGVDPHVLASFWTACVLAITFPHYFPRYNDMIIHPGRTLARLTERVPVIHGITAEQQRRESPEVYVIKPTSTTSSTKKFKAKLVADDAKASTFTTAPPKIIEVIREKYHEPPPFDPNIPPFVFEPPDDPSQQGMGKLAIPIGVLILICMLPYYLALLCTTPFYLMKSVFDFYAKALPGCMTALSFLSDCAGAVEQEIVYLAVQWGVSEERAVQSKLIIHNILLRGFESTLKGTVNLAFLYYLDRFLFRGWFFKRVCCGAQYICNAIMIAIAPPTPPPGQNEEPERETEEDASASDSESEQSVATIKPERDIGEHTSATESVSQQPANTEEPEQEIGDDTSGSGSANQQPVDTEEPQEHREQSLEEVQTREHDIETPKALTPSEETPNQQSTQVNTSDYTYLDKLRKELDERFENVTIPLVPESPTRPENWSEQVGTATRKSAQKKRSEEGRGADEEEGDKETMKDKDFDAPNIPVEQNTTARKGNNTGNKQRADDEEGDKDVGFPEDSPVEDYPDQEEKDRQMRKEEKKPNDQIEGDNDAGDEDEDNDDHDGNAKMRGRGRPS